jgi:hypothetical protein
MEAWKDVYIPPFKFRVSTLGRIHTQPSQFHPMGILSYGSCDPRGYRFITLFDQKGTRKQFNVHRLIALAFLENPSNLPQVNHLDGDPSNNHIENLEWCTASQNQFHAIAIGLRARSSWTLENIGKAARGSRHGNAELTEEIVTEMRAKAAQGVHIPTLAKEYGISRGHAWSICKRRYWLHI